MGFMRGSRKKKIAREKNVEIVDLVKGFPTHIWSQKSASIQRRTDRLEFETEKREPLYNPVEKDIGKTKKNTKEKLDTSFSSHQLDLLGSSMQNTRSTTV